MKYFYQGSGFAVTVSSREVEDFSRHWPCSGLRFKPVTFTFESPSPDHADLCDSNDSQNHPDADGGVVLALCDDAMRYGLTRYYKAT